MGALFICIFQFKIVIMKPIINWVACMTGVGACVLWCVFELRWAGCCAYAWVHFPGWPPCCLDIVANGPIGCSNNNYASREVCKKCGQPKEVAAMPAIAMPGALPTHPHYFARAPGGLGLKMNLGISGHSDLHQSLPSGSNWSYGGGEKYFQTASAWPYGSNTNGGFPSTNNPNQLLMFPKGWRNGDWMCSCGFHNYSSRAQCKKCYASVPSAAPSSVANAAVSDMFPALGTKRLASDEFGNDWDSKRLNAGDINSQFMTNGPQLYHGFEQMASSSNGQISGIQAPFSNGSFVTAPNIPMAMPVPVQAPQLPGVPTLLGKGAKQWRDGDWMCTNCNNHNFASRLQCNRCNSQREAVNSQTVASVA